MQDGKSPSLASRRVTFYAPCLTLTPFHRQSPWMMIPLSLHSLGHDVTLVCGRFRDPAPPPYRVIETGTSRSPRTAVRVLTAAIDPLFAFPRIVAQAPDLVIIGPMGAYLPTLLLLILIHGSGGTGRVRPQFILKFDVNLLDKSRTGLLGWLTNALVSISSRVFDWVTLESTCSTRYAKSLSGVDSDHILWLPLGYPQGLISIRPYASPARQPIILCVGRVEPLKGQDILLQAFIELSREFPDWSLRFVGPVEDGEYARAMKGLIDQNGLRERVSFLGFIEPGARLEAEYSNSSVFCLPTLAESAGQVRYEAIASGLPVVTTEFPCREDLEQIGCVVTAAGSASELVVALRGLMSNPEERQRRADLSQSRIRSYLQVTSDLLARVGFIS